MTMQGPPTIPYMDEPYCCAICGRAVFKHEDLKHACPPRTLAGIDAADTRAWNREFDWSAPARQTLYARLAEGERLLALKGDR